MRMLRHMQGMRGGGLASARGWPEFVRFVLVGGINTLVGYGLFAIFLLLSDDHRLALLGATIIGVLFNFFSTGRLVFGSRRWRRLPLFIGVYALVFALNLGLLDLLVAWGLPALLAQCLALPVCVIVSFLLNRRFVFRETP